MKPISYYSTRSTSSPLAKDYTTVYVYAKGKVVWQGTDREWLENGQGTYAGAVEKVLDDVAFNEALNAYRAERNRLFAEFKADLFEDAGVTGHPKAEKVFALACEYGEWDLAEIAGYFDDIVELIKG